MKSLLMTNNIYACFLVQYLLSDFYTGGNIVSSLLIIRNMGNDYLSKCDNTLVYTDYLHKGFYEAQ